MFATPMEESMSYTLYDAAKSFQNPLAAALFKAIVTEDELFSILPFVPTEGNGFSFTREKALPTAEWVAPTGPTAASNGKEETVTVPVREISSDFDIRSFAIAQQGGQGVVARQMMSKGKAVGREIARSLIRGAFATGYSLYQTTAPFTAVDSITAGPWLDTDRFGPAELEYKHSTTSWRFRGPGDRDFGEWVVATTDGTYTLKSDNPSKWIRVQLDVSDAAADGRTALSFTSSSNEPDGVEAMMDPGQVIAPSAADGDAFSFNVLDQLIDKVKVRDGLAFVMPAALRRKYKDKLRSLGGTSAEYVVNSFDPQSGRPVQRRLLAYDDIPILKNDFIPTNETVGGTSTCSSVYLIALNPNEVRGGLHCRAFGGASTAADVDPISRSVLGFHFEEVGALEGQNSRRWRANFYGAFAYGSVLSMARASGIKTV